MYNPAETAYHSETSIKAKHFPRVMNLKLSFS